MVNKKTNLNKVFFPLQIIMFGKVSLESSHFEFKKCILYIRASATVA